MSSEDKERDDWSGDYNGEICSNCGRERVMLLGNRKRVCEKCCWDQDANEYASVPDWFR